ncbi:helix-turn-helix transcriptional regulator [Rhizobium sullae]|uniref:Helix-turn-helix transcriptional regulator n=1 Tax=Rhizobium sullae TaxID=50338 RepID=A0A2N0D4D7_RHISU|nr:helix-turn-helix transcriptional regulator [Rhizobium sullae]PKA40922.1 helix-turn-helix transcriptional regulator [Rhizobium sullae]UWU14764.1 helix-turn-helix transcriptional regulator [Rhizobium sullae]
MPATTHANLESLTDLVYGALFGETDWQDFLDTLNTRMPDAKTTLFYHDSVAGAGAFSLCSGLDGSSLDDYNRYYCTVNPWMPKAAVRPVGLGVIADQMLPHAELVKTEFYNEYLRSIGCRSSVGVTILRENSRSFNLSTLTSSTDTGFNRLNADLLTQLAPHLQRAFDFMRREKASNETGRSLFDAIGVGLVYIGEGCQIRSMNLAAEQMFAEDAGISVTPTGHLVCSDRDFLERLTSASRYRAPAAAEPFIARFRSSCASFKCTLVRLTSDLMTEFLQGPTAALIIERMPVACPELNDRLSAKEQLTAAELRIASSIAAGLSPREAARLHGISYETARTHLKNIYSKLGVNSQVALVRRLMP